MNRIQKLFHDKRKHLKPWESTPPETILRIAKKCGRSEVAAIHISIMYFRSELAMTAEWDGDTQDDICKAIADLRSILKLV